MENNEKIIEEDTSEGCKYCGCAWFEVNSEGSPCGIDGCDVYTCCEKAWQDHIKQGHPNYKNGDK